MDYQRTLQFQIIPEEVEVQPANPANAKITIPHADEIIKGSYRSFHSTVHVHCLLPPKFFPLTTAKGATVCQVLTGKVFVNFHHLHPMF